MADFKLMIDFMKINFNYNFKENDPIKEWREFCDSIKNFRMFEESTQGIIQKYTEGLNGNFPVKMPTLAQFKFSWKKYLSEKYSKSNQKSGDEYCPYCGGYGVLYVLCCNHGNSIVNVREPFEYCGNLDVRVAPCSCKNSMRNFNGGDLPPRDYLDWVKKCGYPYSVTGEEEFYNEIEKNIINI